MKSIIIISGPTASGKTGFAIELCKRMGGEVVNADSVQVYKKFDIGSAKPTSAEMKSVPHHLIDVLEPSVKVDAEMFMKMADEAIDGIIGRKAIPFVAGGTGFYIKALLFGLMEAPHDDEEIRRRLDKEAAERGWPAIHERLQEIDPEAAEKISPNDKQRIQRALEYYYITGQTISAAQKEHGFKSQRYRHLHLALNPPREMLNENINKRVDEMLNNGLLDEVKTLLQNGVAKDAHPMRSHGYSHAIKLFDGVYDLEEFTRLVKRDHRRYAKRQMTWLKNQPEVTFISYPYDIDAVEKKAAAFLNET